jgi:pseudouridine-5'-phosphate glycosidase
MIASAVEWHWALGNHSSILITTPIKAEDAIDNREVDAVIEKAMITAEKDGVRGNALTKYLMRAVDKVTEGRSAKANMSVLISTAELAGRVAAAHAPLRLKAQPRQPPDPKSLR